MAEVVRQYTNVSFRNLPRAEEVPHTPVLPPSVESEQRRTPLREPQDMTNATTRSNSQFSARSLLLLTGNPFLLIGRYGPSLGPVATVRVLCGGYWAL